ncbi:MAG TPA: DUF721 domain-containing protein [Chromatiales bacterium]|nr:DUF721 domain-containing protein [Chromatiales bacterium]
MRSVQQFVPRHLRARIHQVQDLERLLQASLPEEARPHCRAGGVQHGRLVVVTDSSVWATRLRFQAQTLLAAMRSAARGGISVPDRISVCVQPPGHPPRTALPPVRIPRSAAIPLLTTAATVPDPRLARALRRMARRAGG